MNKRVLTACLLLLVLCACQRAEQAQKQEEPPVFPPLGAAKPVEKGVVVHQVSLPGRVWIYLPEKLPATPIPCIFIAPAGVPPFVGNGFGTELDRYKHPEHLPWVHAGFAVAAYDVDGEVANVNDVTYEEVETAARAFKNADAGMRNAKRAIDYVLKMVPAVDPKRLYAVGHSSAGREALLLAESDPRIAACVAFAPVTDVERRVNENNVAAGSYLEVHIDGFEDFLKQTSPIKQVSRLTCPLFLFHSEADGRIDIAESDAFFEQLTKTNPNVTYVRASHGDHFDSMVEQGVPQAIRWVQSLSSPAISRASKAAGSRR